MISETMHGSDEATSSISPESIPTGNNAQEVTLLFNPYSIQLVSESPSI